MTAKVIFRNGCRTSNQGYLREIFDLGNLPFFGRYRESDWKYIWSSDTKIWR